jgi:hypothetical protein
MVFYGILLLALTAATKFLTADDVCGPGLFVNSLLMNVMSFATIFVAGFAGGFTATRLAGSRRPAWTLACILAVPGLVHFALALTAGPFVPKARTGQESMEVVMDELSTNVQPSFAIAGPVIAIVAFVISARVALRSPRF